MVEEGTTVLGEGSTKTEDTKPEAPAADPTPKPDGDGGQKPADGGGEPDGGTKPDVKDDTTGTKAGEGKDDPGKETKPNAPEKYELKLPGEATLVEGNLQFIEGLARELDLDNVNAQKVVDHADKLVQAHFDARLESWDKETEGWKDELKKDADYGGEQFDANKELAKQALRQFGDQPLIDALEETGYGNHPGLVKMLTRIGKAMSEDNLVMGGDASGGKSDGDLFFGPGTEVQKGRE